MSKSFRKIFLFIIAYFLFNIMLYSQEKIDNNKSKNTVVKLNLDDCIKVALNNNPDIRVANEETKIAVSDLNITKARKKVKLNASLKTEQFLKSKYDDNGSEPLDSRQIPVPFKHTDLGLAASLNMSYKIVDPGFDDRYEIDVKQVDISKVNNKQNINEIIFNVKNNYFSLLHAKSIVRIKEKMKENYEQRLEKVRILVENGDRPVLDLSSIEVDVANVALDYEEAKNNLQNIKSDLLSSMGVFEEDLNFDIYQDDFFKEKKQLRDLKFDLDMLYKLSDSHSLELLKAIYMLEVSRKNVALAQSLDDLSVDFSMGGGMRNESLHGTSERLSENYESDNWSPYVIAQFSAVMPLYSGGSITAQVDKANSDFSRKRFNVRKVKIELRKKIKNNFKILKRLKKLINISNLNIKNAETNLRLAQKSYLHGIEDQESVNRAELNFLNAQTTMLNSKLSYIKTLAQLANLIGVGEDYICIK